MPKGEAWIKFLFVNVGFIIQVFAMYFSIQIKDIKDHWSLYRCNPMYMPLSDDIGRDFIYCVQGIQTNFIGYLLTPLTYILSGLGDITSGFLGDLSFGRQFFHYLRMQFLGIFGGLYHTFLSIGVEFERMIITIKDVIAKLIGIVYVCMHMVQGALYTTQSAWAGPPGQMVRTIGSCFLPQTKVQLKNGTILEMQHIQPGDILINGCKVRAVMRIDNTNEEDIYVFSQQGVLQEDIYVTGSHHVFDLNIRKYIPVKDHPLSQKINDITTPWFSCLITERHRIPIGNMIFWDWEDYML